MNNVSLRFCLICIASISINASVLAEGYSNNSRGPYHHVYSHPIDSQEIIPEVVVVDALEESSISLRSSSTRTVSNLETGNCFANLDYNGSVNDSVSKRTRVLCRSRLDANLVRRIQGSLATQGFNDISVTGELDTRTLGALYRFQVSRNLPAGAVTTGTLNSLGITL